MHLRVAIEDGRPDIELSSAAELDQALSDADSRSRDLGLLNIIILKAPNDDWLSLVVGGDETVLSFNYGHGEPPYFVSKGEAHRDEPVLTAFVGLAHHTEFSRRWVIPMSAARSAALEFATTGQRPSGIDWVEV
ncbi:MAG TPA: Imm1 family immunity protein [Steroidobacteraceae bacterium]|nr:Imm1 family immunity protein [Steroidobacteraceae bacterium]